jgi:hypothetical protein
MQDVRSNKQVSISSSSLHRYTVLLCVLTVWCHTAWSAVAGSATRVDRTSG